MDNREKAFKWSDFDAVQALENTTVKGFLSAVNNAFDADSSTRMGFALEITKVITRQAINDGVLSEPMMDLIAEQMGFPVWEYVGRFNLIAPFDTVLKRKREMLKNIERLMEVRGTPYAVAETLRAFGFTNVIIHENRALTFLYDGTYNYDGVAAYAGDFKHNLFDVELTSVLDLVAPGNPDEQIDAIVNIVNQFKKLRPELYQVKVHTPSVPAGDTRTVWGGFIA